MRFWASAPSPAANSPTAGGFIAASARGFKVMSELETLSKAALEVLGRLDTSDCDGGRERFGGKRVAQAP